MEGNTKILILSDSLPLPRSKPEVVDYKNTWPEILKGSEGNEVFQISIGGGTVEDIFDQASYYKNYLPDVVIIQSGIVDCAPRALSRMELKILLSSELTRILLSRVLPLKVMRRIRKKTYVNRKKFTEIYSQLISQFNSSKIVLIGILPISEEYNIRVGGIKKNRDDYNEIIHDLAKFHNCFYINTDNIPVKGIMSDFHHLNDIGHTWLGTKINDVLSYLLVSNQNG